MVKGLINPPVQRPIDCGRGPMLFGALACLGLFGGLSAWGMVATLESAVIAPAVVRVEGRRLSLDHPDGGTIAALLVREGDRVEAGQALLRLDTSQQEAEYAVLRRRHDALRATAVRLAAELAGQSALVWPADVNARRRDDTELNALLVSQQALLSANHAVIANEQSLLQQRIQQLDERLAGLEAQLSAQTEQSTIISQELKTLTALLDKGLAHKSRILALRREASRLSGIAGSLRAEAAQARIAKAEAQTEIGQIEQKRLSALLSERNATLAELAAIAPRLAMVETSMARAELKAPGSGVVFGLTKFTPGGVIRPAESILEIVPDDRRIVIEARLRPVDRADLYEGMAVRVRFAAWERQMLPPVDGSLVRISADAITTREDQNAYYALEIVLNSDSNRNDLKDLTPGMPAEAIVPLAARSPIGYLLEPLLRHWRHALRES